MGSEVDFCLIAFGACGGEVDNLIEWNEVLAFAGGQDYFLVSEEGVVYELEEAVCLCGYSGVGWLFGNFLKCVVYHSNEFIGWVGFLEVVGSAGAEGAEEVFVVCGNYNYV